MPHSLLQQKTERAPLQVLWPGDGGARTQAAVRSRGQPVWTQGRGGPPGDSLSSHCFIFHLVMAPHLLLLLFSSGKLAFLSDSGHLEQSHPFKRG